MSIELVTGYTGNNHVSAEDDGLLYAGIFGVDSYVLNVGNKLAATLSGTTVTIQSGSAVMQGRHVRLVGTNDISFSVGTQGETRKDAICLEYNKTTSTGKESVSLVVYEDEAYPADAGSIVGGDTLAYMVLYYVNVSGTTYTITPAFKVAGNLGSTYPVGATYLSLTETNPSALFGGTWTLVKTLRTIEQLQYRVHVQNIGDQAWVAEGNMAGTSGKSYRLEGMWIEPSESTSVYVWQRTA